ncbi:Galactose binding lectin domain-containing protein, partial [Flavobacterium sp. CF136]
MIQKLFLFVLSTFFKFLPNKKRLLYTFLFIALGLVNGYGQTNTWTGTTSTAWETTTNWSLNLVPTTAHDVVIPNVINKPTISVAGAVCKTLSINNILGGSTNTLTITSPGTLVVSGAITMTAPTAGTINTTIAVGAGSLTAASVTMNDSGNDNLDCILSLSTGVVNISGNITMSGSTARNQIAFSGAGTLNIGGTMSGGGLTPSTGTVNYNNSGTQTVGAYTYNNLILSGSGTKTFGAITTVSGNWSMISGVLANLGGFTHTAGTLVLGGAGPLLSSWGSTTSGATNTTNDYFTGTGRINVSSAPYPAIDNNYASYTSGVTGQVAGTQGEYSNPPTNTLPGSLTLSAPAGSAFINVKFASYGSPGGTSPNFTIGSCHAFNSRTVTTGLLGQNIATIPASGSFNATFGDPCYGIVKSYNVVATYAEPFCTTSGVSSFVINGSQPTGGNGTYTYLWEKSTTGHSTGYAAASGTNNAKDYTVSAGTSQTTWYRRTVTSGIYSDATIVIVQVVTGPPTVPTSFTSATSCAGTTTLSVSGGSLGGLGGYVEFSTGSCGGTVVGTSNSIPATLVVSPTVGNTTYYVRYKNACGNTTCLSTIATNTVSIAAAASATAVCFSAASQNASLAYTATAGTPTKYSIVWDTAAVTAGLVNQTDTSFAFVATGGTLNTIAIPANVPAGTYTGILTVKNGSNCVSFKNNFTVTVNPIPTVTNSPLTQTICSGGSSALVTLTSGVAGTTFAWTATATAGVSGFTASGTSTIPVQTISTTGTTQGTVTYVITPTASGCPGTAT